MNYVSTRGGNENVSAAQAIKQGLALNGGLFMPEKLETLSEDDLNNICNLSYPETAALILSRYLTDYSYDELLADCKKAYGTERFPDGAVDIAPLGDRIKILELWHGPTCAFKDMALQIMPHLLSRALVKTDEKRTALILVATSGDTGKAALEGYRDVDGIKIEVFYPETGVSKIQKKQMATQEGGNVRVCAIKGNFDDAQNGVKKIFSDEALRRELDESGVFLSSANSINWGRLVPQIVYYVYAYCNMVKSGDIKMGEKIDVCVPTGNFGNIFAAYIAKKMGTPIDKLICASNCNNVLTDFLRTGTYDRNREFHATISPSMDILISSNLERLLYLAAGSEKTGEYMRSLSESGKYTVEDDIKAMLDEHFIGYYCPEEGTRQTIKSVFDKGYLCDTHTAVALYCADKYINEGKSENKLLVASTASPYKFATSVLGSISDNIPEDEFDALDALAEVSGVKAPAPLSSLRTKEPRFTTTIDKADMQEEVKGFANE